MATSRRPPTGARSGPVLDPYQVVLRPMITEKSTSFSERNAYTFEVNKLATKTEIKAAVEELFTVKVVGVRTSNRHAKPKRHKMSWGKGRTLKKAVVAVDPEHRIDFF